MSDFLLSIGKKVILSSLLLTTDTLLITQHFEKVHGISDTVLMLSSCCNHNHSVTVLCGHQGRFHDLTFLLLENISIC